MERRKFTREFKLEAVKLIRERGVSVAQAARDLGVNDGMLYSWAIFVSRPGKLGTRRCHNGYFAA